MSTQVSQGIIVINKQGGKGNSGISMIKCIPVLKGQRNKGIDLATTSTGSARLGQE